MKRKHHKKSFDWYGMKQRFSIRKYHFGAASVLIGTTLFLMGSPSVLASELGTSQGTNTELISKTEKKIETPKEVVSKEKLQSLLSELKSLITEVSASKLGSVENQERIYQKADSILHENEATQESVNEQVSLVQNSIDSLKRLKEEKTQSKSNEETVGKKEVAEKEKSETVMADDNKTVALTSDKVENPSKAEEITNNSTNEVSSKIEKVETTIISSDSDKKKLETLAKNLDEYLKPASEITRPETKELLKGVEETVLAVKKGLENPQLNASEIEELVKQGKEAEKKLVLAVTREHSGKRDSRNGNKMLPESYFRAPNTREGANTEFGNAYTAWMITNDDVRRFQSAGTNDPNYHGYNYSVGTFLYNSNNAENSPINNNNMQGPQRITWTRNRVYVQVNRVSGNEQSGYEFNWKIQFNAGREPHQKPFYYFTLPDGHDFSSSVVLKENESQIATGSIDDVLQKSKGILNGKMGTTEGVYGGEYYRGTGLINGRPYIQAPIRTLEDFVKNSTNYYFNRSGVNGDIIQKSDFLFENIKNSTKNIIAIQPQGTAAGGFNHSYSFEFTTHSSSADDPYYIAGVKTYETTMGLTQHRSYSQWGSLKDAYTIKTDSFTNADFKKKTFLKGTQLGAFENSSYSFNSDDVSTVKGDSFIDAGLVLRNNTTGQDERPQKGKLLLKITPTATIDGSKYSHIHNLYNYNNPNDSLTNSKDRTKGGHLAYLEGTYNGSKIKLPFSFNIVTQSDIFEPVKNETKENQARKTTDTLGNAADFISGYNNVSSRIPDLFTNWNQGNTGTFRNIFKGNSETFPGSSNDIKNRAIKNVEWADGNSNITGEKIVPVKVRYTPQGAAAYEETKYVTLPRELNNLSIGQALTEAQKQKIIELAKSTFDADSASFDGNTAKVGVKKQVKITYMDNEKNALTGNKDDSVRYVDFHFTNLTVPDSNKPVVTMNGNTLTTDANDNRFIIYRGAAFNPTFKVTDESKIGSLMVTNLPKGVYFNKIDNVDKARVGTTTVLNHTISDADSNKVADDATLGEQIGLVEASDQYGNRETYKFKYRIVDIQAKNSTTENRAVGSTLGDPHDHFKVAESNTADSDKYYPTNMQFKWKEIDLRNGTITDVANETKLNELGTIAKYTATAVFPGVVNTKEIDRVNYTIYSPAQKVVPMTFNVTDSVAPTVKMTNPTNNTESVLGSNENNLPVVEVFRGATLNIPLKMFDNNTNGKINIKQISGLPAGVTLKDGNTVINNGNTLSKNSGSETNPATATITGTVAPNATLGTNVVTLKVSDDATGDVNKGNQATLKFKVKTYDLAFEEKGTPVNDNTRSDVLRLNENSVDPNHYLAITDGRNVTNNWGSGMVFRYLKENNEIREHVSFDKIGKHSVKARAYFPTNKTSTQGLPTNSSGLTGDTAATAGRGYLEKTIEFNVKPDAPTIAQPQFYGTASSKPTVTVENLPTNAQLLNGSTVTVELYQGNNKVATKTVTDGNSTTTLSAENFTTNLTEGQPVHAVVKVSGGQGATAYSVNSDNSENRNVTGRSTLSNLATDKLVVQVQDLTNNRGGTLSEREKQAIKQAIFEANKNGVLRGKQVSDINISDTGLITALDKDNKIAELQINPNTGVVTRFAHIREDYNITYTNNGKPVNRPTDPGFEWSGDGKSLIYKFDATSGVGLDVNEVLKTITATPKNTQGQPSLTTVTGNDKALGEANSNGFSRNASTGYFSKNGVGVNVLDLVNPTNYRGGGNISNTGNKLVDINHGDVNGSNIIGTNLETGNTTITGANGSNSITLNNVVKGRSGNSLIEHKQLYLMPKYTDGTLLTDRGTTATGNTNVINVYFVPVDPRKPEVSRPATSSLAATKEAITNAQNVATGTNGKISSNFLTSKVDVRDNYDSPDQAKAKLEMYVQKDGENTRTKVIENNRENTDAISTIVRNAEQGNGTSYYKVIAKTTDRSGNVSDEAVVGWFKVEEKGKPTVKLVQNNQDTTLSESTPEASVPKVTVYRGEKAEITVKASDNTGKLSSFTTSGLPSGVTENGANSSDSATDARPLSHTLSGKVATDTTLGDKVLTVVASDKTTPTNTTTVKFKLDVKAQNEKYNPTAGTTPVAVNNIGGISASDLEKIKNSVSVPNLSQEARDGGVTKSIKNSGTVTINNGKKYVTVEVTYPDTSKDEVLVEVQQNTNVQKQPTIYVVKGETISNEELRKFVYLPNGAQKEELPSTATVTATLDTATKGSKTINVTVTFQGSNPVVVPVTYEVIQNFPVANKVYDFAGVSRGSGSTDYYVNQGLRSGMSWFVEKETVEGGQKVFKKVSSDNNMNTQIASDITAGVGEYRYKLGAKFREGRFTNQADEAARLSYSGEIVHTVYDVVANTTKVEATYGSTLTNSQAESAVMRATNSQNLPTGTTYEWVANASGTAATNLTVSTYGEETRYVKVTLPKTREAGLDSAAATQVNPYKVIEVKVKVNETVKPTVKLVSDNGEVTLSESTLEASLPKVTVYRGENATITVKASDNTGKVQNLTITNLPTGLTPDNSNQASDTATDATPLTKTTTGNVNKTETVGEKVATVTVSDKSNPANTTTVQFKVDVKEQKDKYNPQAKDPKQEVNRGAEPSAEGSVVTDGLPTGTTYSWKEGHKPNTTTSKENPPGEKDGVVVVTYPDGTTDEVPVKVKVSLSSAKGEPATEFEIEIPQPIVVPNPDDLTPEEKTELEKKVKKSNPNMDVKVDDKGNVTVTDPKTGQSKVIPVKDLTVKDFEPVKPTEKVPVKDKAHLTSEEKKQVADKVKDKNPGKEVTVGDDGTATVTDPTTGISHTIPGTDLVNQDFEPVKPDGKVPVKDKAHLTPEEKKQVADKVKAKNPGKEVTVGDDGTATVTDPTTGISHTIPGTDLVNQDFEPVKPDEKVPVKDKAHLTPDEKKQVADKVKAKNPGKEVTVGDDGTATVTDPTTGISHTIPATDLVIEFAKGDSTKLEVPGLIITKWTDEQGNDLKQPDAKAPSVPGEANEAFEPGEIDGYVFVRTEVKGNIVTHIFRKVSSTETSGDDKPQSTPEVPTDNIEHKPETITPNEQTTETENPTAKPKASQNILPNTGTADGLGIFSTAVASILAGLGLFLPVKKEDEDEEETQNN